MKIELIFPEVVDLSQTTVTIAEALAAEGFAPVIVHTPCLMHMRPRGSITVTGTRITAYRCANGHIVDASTTRAEIRDLLSRHGVANELLEQMWIDVDPVRELLSLGKIPTPQ